MRRLKVWGKRHVRSMRRGGSACSWLIGASPLLQIRPRYLLHEGDGDAPIALCPHPEHLAFHNTGRQTLPVNHHRSPFEVWPCPCVMALEDALQWEPGAF